MHEHRELFEISLVYQSVNRFRFLLVHNHLGFGALHYPTSELTIFPNWPYRIDDIVILLVYGGF